MEDDKDVTSKGTKSGSRSDLRLDMSNVSTVPPVPIVTPTRSRARALSLAIPSILTPSASSPKAIDFSQILASPLDIKSPEEFDKAHFEVQKVLSLLLSRLHDRPRAPSTFDSFKYVKEGGDAGKTGIIPQPFKGAVRRGRSAGPGSIDGITKELRRGADDGDSDDEGENDNSFTTDVTLDIMTQLRDLLLLSENRGWNILSTSSSEMPSNEQRPSMRSSPSSSPFRRRRSGSNARSPSPGHSRSRNPGASLLAQSISLLGDIIISDCRFRTSSSRPFQPPNALQSVCLDVAQCFVSYCSRKRDAKNLAEIGMAVLPAFGTFGRELHTKLLAFFEDGVLRGMLDDLARIQGGKKASNLVPNDVESSLMPSRKGTFPGPPVVQIDAPDEHSAQPAAQQQTWQPWSRLSATPAAKILSTTAPSQPAAIYHLSALIPPLLAAILDNVDLPTSQTATAQRLHRLFELIVTAKPDAYLDVLEVVAYHTNRARLGAVSLLVSFWPKAVGHLAVGKPLPTINFLEDLARLEGVQQQYPLDHPYTHQFRPWRFTSRPSGNAQSPRSPETLGPPVTQNACHACFEAISGFGLMCAFCTCVVHFNCYDSPEGSFLTQYPLASDPNTQKVAITRFSNIISARRTIAPALIAKSHHAFRPVNLFTLALCLICHKPLWGCVMQALQCASCRQFVHTSCLSSELLPRCRSLTLSSALITIDWSVLRSSFAEHYHELFLSEEDLAKRSYEEVSIYHSILWTQLQILINGIASGSFIVEQKNPKTNAAKENMVDEFELQYLVRLYEAYLSSGRLPKSHAVEEFLRLESSSTSDHSIMFNWSLIVYITSLIRSPLHPTPEPIFSHPSGLLRVDSPDHAEVITEEHSFEVVALSHIRDALGYELNLFSDVAARHLLAHIHDVGLFQRSDLAPELFTKDSRLTEEYCTFPLPLSIDLSMNVETLVVAIESCLGDIDISVNEVGFLLLVRRCWPNCLTSEYASNRLAKLVASWIMAEDDRLLSIARDYVAIGRVPPGIRSTHDLPSWPSSTSARLTGLSSANSGGDYVASRRQLLAKYAMRWLLALHDLDPDLYARALFEECVELADRRDQTGLLEQLLQSKATAEREMQRKVEWADRILRHILKLCEASVVFSRFDDLFMMWLDAIADLISADDVGPRYPIVVPALLRLFEHDAKTARRSTVLFDMLATVNPISGIFIDPWRVIIDVASEGGECLLRSVRWLRVLAQSGVDIPVSTFMQISAFARDFQAPFEIYEILVEAILAFIWIKPVGVQDFLKLISNLHVRLADDINERLLAASHLAPVHRLIRHTLATYLLLIGCPREVVLGADLILVEETAGLSERKRAHGRFSSAVAKPSIDVDFIFAIGQYVANGADAIGLLVAKFIGLLMTDASLEPQEVDEFILANGETLCQCAWKFYNIQLREISSMRISILLRLLVVDTEPFRKLLEAQVQLSDDWEIRFQAVTRLFRVILDIKSFEAHIGGRQWHSSIVFIFQYFFPALWQDTREEVRLSTETLMQTLLPGHMEAITACWDEYLAKSINTDRIKLVHFLIQLHPHFPTWQVLSWDTILDALDDDILNFYGGEDNRMSAATENGGSIFYDDETSALQAALLSLSLQMIADGIRADMLVLLKIKQHLVKVLGFVDSEAPEPALEGAAEAHFGRLTSIREASFLCTNGILRVLDAPTFSESSSTSTLPPNVPNSGPTAPLIGAVLVDVVLAVIVSADLVALPYTEIRTWLEALIIIICKHNVQHSALRHLAGQLTQAAKHVTDLALVDLSYDLRQLAISVAQAFLQRCPDLTAKILSRQIVTVCSLLTSLKLNAEDVLVAQGKAFLEAAFMRFSAYGLFFSLFKRDPLPAGFFTAVQAVMKDNAKAHISSAVDGETLKDSVLRDSLGRLFERRDQPISVILRNLATYVETVHHQAYSPRLIQAVGLSLTYIARRTADWPSNTFDPNPLLRMSATIIQHNKLISRDLILHSETLLRSVLVRFDVEEASLKKLLHITITLFRKTPQDGNGLSPSHLVLAVIEVLSDVLKGKAGASSSTLAAMLEAVNEILRTEYQLFPGATWRQVAADALLSMYSPPLSDRYTSINFTIFLSTAELVLRVSVQDANFLKEQLAEAPFRLPLPVRAWNALALVASQNPKLAPPVMGVFSEAALAHCSALRPLTNLASLSMADSGPADLTHAYASIKLWLLLARQRNRNTTPDFEESIVWIGLVEDEGIEYRLWNQLWPSFEAVVAASLSTANGEISPISTMIWHSFADLVTFTHQSRLSIAQEATPSQVRYLEKIQRLIGSEKGAIKFTRTLGYIAEPPPDTPFEEHVLKARTDLLAAEKLSHTYEMRRRGGLY
ncbi:hypothetical protein BOTBODRAFT_180257 [Botryobasidium botryosum FD-172 SS1]|uniref:Phorbol-ester/DAG-type domain-containing protein n=1 Tax=Botryobasidium botryosum (strain FD-172 SS1) TaxID=930990 RepID=A0A067LXJ0_BOTB1|nr:hypothetical protein BOTBODRAFT_180257 [Botryobasidium botryosum FD-172 SS1]